MIFILQIKELALDDFKPITLTPIETKPVYVGVEVPENMYFYMEDDTEKNKPILTLEGYKYITQQLKIKQNNTQPTNNTTIDTTDFDEEEWS